MNTREFVDAIQTWVVNTVAPDNVQCFIDPPGRRPDPGLVEMGQWYRGLSKQDQTMVERAMAMAARDSVFGVFAALDGALKIDNGDPGDYFELRHVRGDQVDIISGQDTPLHEFLE